MTPFKLAVLTALFTLCFISAQYQNNVLIKLRIDNKQKYDLFFTVFPQDTLDFWSCNQEAGVGVDMTILFTFDKLRKLAVLGTDFFGEDAKLEILNANLQQMVDNEAKRIQQIRDEQLKRMSQLKTVEEQRNFLFSEDEYFKSYHKTSEIIAFMDALSGKYPGQIEKEVIGKSFKGQDIIVYRIHGKGAWDPSKPAVFFNSLQHAREWISGATTNYIIYHLLKNESALLDKVNIHYVPVTNPDGYDKTWTSGNRFWRKNLRGDGRQEWGVDLNRNWPSGWGGSGSSSSRSSETYRGETALSEPETKAIAEYVKKHPNIKGSIDFHAYSQLMMRPWGKSRTNTPDEQRLKELGQKMVDAIRREHGQTYTNQRAVDLYVASGIMSDTMYENFKVWAPYTIELRPRSGGLGGFVLPPEQIIPTGQENLAAVKVLLDAVATAFAK